MKTLWGFLDKDILEGGGGGEEEEEEEEDTFDMRRKDERIVWKIG